MSEEMHELARKIGILAAQRDNAVKELKRTQEALADLERELSQTREELHKKTLDVEFLTVSHKLADTPQALADTRNVIRKMIVKIDKAMAMLKEDARI